MNRGGSARGKRSPVTRQTLLELALLLPECEVGMSYRTPACKVRGKLFARLHQSGDSVVVRIDRRERLMRMQADPKAFYITDHYAAYPWVLVRLSAIRRADLADLLEDAWRLSAPKRLLASYEARGR